MVKQIFKHTFDLQWFKIPEFHSFLDVEELMFLRNAIKIGNL